MAANSHNAPEQYIGAYNYHQQLLPQNQTVYPLHNPQVKNFSSFSLAVSNS